MKFFGIRVIDGEFIFVVCHFDRVSFDGKHIEVVICFLKRVYLHLEHRYGILVSSALENLRVGHRGRQRQQDEGQEDKQFDVFHIF